MIRNVCAVVTARPSYSRIRSVLQAIREHPDLRLQLVLAASALLERYGNVSRQIERDGFQAAAKVYMVLEGENLTAMAKTTGVGLMELATVFDNLKPDIVVTVADRYETIATAIAASFTNIPVAHVQGGEVTGSIDEKVRHAVTKLSDYHFVATEQAAQRVVRMGEIPERVFVTGCPSIDLAAEVVSRPRLDFDPMEKYGGVGPKVDLAGGYLVVLQHPVTTEHAEARAQVEETLEAVRQAGLPAFWFWPNVDAGSDGTSKGIRIFRERHPEANIHLFKNMDPVDFLRLLNNAQAIVGNSSAAIRECSFLGVPAVNVGSRQQGRERGPNVLDVAHDRREILDALRRWKGAGRPARVNLYGDGRAHARIAGLLASLPLTCEKRLTY